MKKKLLTLILAFAMMFAFAGVALAEDVALTSESSTLTSGTYIVPNGGLTIDGYLTVPAGEVVIIDLNGQNLTVNFTDAENETDYDDAGIVNSGTLTIKDSVGEGTYTAVAPTTSITSSTYTTFSAIHNKAGGELNLDSGTIKSTCSAGDRKTYGVYSATSTASELNLTNADIVVTSGTSTTTKYAYGIYAGYHDVNMTGGTITVVGGKGAAYGIYAEYGDVYMDGEITVSGYSTVYGMYAKASDVEMSGEMYVTGLGTSTIYGASLATSGSFELSGSMDLDGTSYVYGVYTTASNLDITMVDGAEVDIYTSGSSGGRGLHSTNSAVFMEGGSIVVDGNTASPSGVYGGTGTVVSGGSITLKTQPDGYTSQFMGVVEVIGGSFNFDPSAYVRAYTHEAIENDGIWTVSELANPMVNVKNTTTGATYANLQDALDGASEGDVLQMQNDYDAGGAAFTIDTGITLDLNGCDITGTTTYLITINGGIYEEFPVIITDTAATCSEEMGTITAGGYGITLSTGVQHFVELKNIKVETTFYGVYCNSGLSTASTQLLIDGAIINVVREASGAVYGIASSSYVEITVQESDGSNFPTQITASNVNSSTAYCVTFYISGNTTLDITGGTFTAVSGGITSTYYPTCGVFFSNTNISNVSISGGYWTVSNTGTVEPMIVRCSDTILHGTNTNISGGYYNIAPNEGYLEDGYVLVDDSSIDGYAYTVSASPLATVGATEYNSLANAISAVEDGGTITLLRDVTLASTLAVAKDFVIEYEGNTITYMGSPAVTVASGMTLPASIDDAQFEATITTSAGVTEYYNTVSKAISAASTSETVVLNTDATMDEQTVSQSLNLDLAGHSITLNDDGTLSFQGGFTSSSATRTLNLTNSSETAGVIYGSVSVFTSGGQYIANIGENVEIRDNSPMAVLGSGAEDSVVINIYGKLIVEVEGDESIGATISGNGNGSNDGTTINIYEGAEVYGVVTAIYHPQDGNINIYGGTITGATGSAIEVKGGTVNIYGGTLISNASESHTVNNGGTSTTGYAVALVENGNYDTDEELVSVTITDGTFEGVVAKVVDSERTGEEILSISGGTYTIAPDVSNIVDGYTAILNNDLYVIAMVVETDVENTTGVTVEGTGVEETLEFAIVIDESKVDESEQTPLDTAAAAYTGDDVETSAVFHIYATVDGSVVNSAVFSDSITITIDYEVVADTTYKVLHLKSDNTVETLTATADVTAGTLSFKVDSLSAFMVVSTPTVYATYTYYDIDLTITGEGTITPTGGDNATITTAKGGSRMFTFTPADGYEIADVIVDGTSVGAVDTYYFASISADHTLEVVFATEDGSTTVDNSLNAMDEDAYYYNAILWAIEEGMIDEDDETLTTIVAGSTRAESVYFMWIAYGSPVVDIENPFTDIDTDDYYYNAVLWAYSVDITAGTTTTTFSPDDVCTRAQIASFIHRAEGEPTVESDNDFTDLTDGAYYVNAINWAVSEEIVAGMTTSTFEPSTDCARTHILTFLYRYLG